MMKGYLELSETIKYECIYEDDRLTTKLISEDKIVRYGFDWFGTQAYLYIHSPLI